MLESILSIIFSILKKFFIKPSLNEINACTEYYKQIQEKILTKLSKIPEYNQNTINLIFSPYYTKKQNQQHEFIYYETQQGLYKDFSIPGLEIRDILIIQDCLEELEEIACQVYHKKIYISSNYRYKLKDYFKYHKYIRIINNIYYFNEYFSKIYPILLNPMSIGKYLILQSPQKYIHLLQILLGIYKDNHRIEPSLQLTLMTSYIQFQQFIFQNIIERLSCFKDYWNMNKIEFIQKYELEHPHYSIKFLLENPSCCSALDLQMLEQYSRFQEVINYSLKYLSGEDIMFPQDEIVKTLTLEVNNIVSELDMYYYFEI